MMKKIKYPFLFLQLVLFLIYPKNLLSETKNYIDETIKENENIYLINLDEIEKIISNNSELRSLRELVNSSGFNLSSKIAKKYPSLDLQASGLPKYVAGKNYNSNLTTTKTSQFSINPSLNLKWDLIDPLRGPEIKIARKQFKIAKNNFDIKRRDLIQEARARYHKYQKSYQDIENQKYALDLSKTSLNNAQAKLDAGIGTKFEVLEADTQLSRDQQSLNEKKVEHKINEISLKEILNIKKDFEIKKQQKLSGFWNHKLNKNIKMGMTNNLSLENIKLQKDIRKNQGISFLNANKPNIYLSNTFSTAFTKGDASSISIDSSEYGSTYTNTVSLNFSWNIFNGGKNKKSYRSSQKEAKSQEYLYKNFQNILNTNISKAYLNLKLNEEKILSSLKEISSTNESLRLARLRYDVGISTLKDVLIRQKDLSQAKSKNVDAVLHYNLNLDELERLTSLKISDTCINENKIENRESLCNFQK